MGESTNIGAITAEVVRRIPPYIESIAVHHNVGIAIGALALRDARRRIVVLESDSTRATALRQRFEHVIADASLIDDPVDAAILAPETEEEWGELTDTITEIARNLADDGCVFLVAPIDQDMADIVIDHGLVKTDESEFAANPPNDTKSHTVLTLHKKDYDRFTHARDLAESGHPDWAVDLLAEKEGRDNEEELRRQMKMHQYLLVWDDRDGHDDRLRRFFLSQSLFANITAISPQSLESFKIHAAMWTRLGDAAMGERLMRTINYARLGKIETPHKLVSTRVSEPEPLAHDEYYQPRLLVILEAQPDYGADVLFDGLANVLGDEHVVDFPWKGSLHGQEPTTQQHYPCIFNRAGKPLELENAIEQMAAQQFDALLYCAHTNKWSGEELRELTAASPETPIYIIDQSDSPVNHRAAMAAHIGAPNDAPYFKREMLQCVDYGANTFPLPFAYPSDRLKSTRKERGVPLFWAGHRRFGLRRLYLEQIESLLGQSFDQKLTQQAYAEQIAKAQIGLNFFGFGYDTVRYWELPAHGCMLLSEQLPIRIPNNFVHGESAVFFDDLEELERLLVYYSERPEEAAQIARSGRDHLERHHTGAARAKQFLARIQQLQVESASR